LTILKKNLKTNTTLSANDAYFAKKAADAGEEFTIISPQEQLARNAAGIDFSKLELFKNISLRPNNIFIGMWKVEAPRTRTQKEKDNEKNLRIKKDIYELSKKAKAGFTHAAHWLEANAVWQPVYSKKEDKNFYFKTNFITLGIPSTSGDLIPRKDAELLTSIDFEENIFRPSEEQQEQINSQIVSPKLFQKLLNGFLTNMRERFGLHHYLWIIEPQANGQLHCHLNTDTFIHYSDINNYWNMQLSKNGLLDNFEKKYGHCNPPSTDVHSIRNSFDAVGYVCSYMKKNKGFKTPYAGNMWGCSMGLKPSRTVSVKLQQKEFNLFGKEMLKHNFFWKPCIHKDCISGEEKRLGSIFFLKHEEWRKILKTEIREAYENHIMFLQSTRSWMPKEYYQIDMFAPDKKVILKKQELEKVVIEPPEIIPINQLTIDYPF
jgi:hypothetical protein